MIYLSKGSSKARPPASLKPLCLTSSASSVTKTLWNISRGYSDDKRGYLWEAGERKHGWNMCWEIRELFFNKLQKIGGILILKKSWLMNYNLIEHNMGWMGIHTNICYHDLFRTTQSSIILTKFWLFRASLGWHRVRVKMSEIGWFQQIHSAHNEVKSYCWRKQHHHNFHDNCSHWLNGNDDKSTS